MIEDQTLAAWVITSLAGALIFVFGVWLKDRRVSERRLVDLIQQSIKLMARIDSHLDRSELVERFGRVALAESVLADPPRRRKLDRVLDDMLHEADDDGRTHAAVENAVRESLDSGVSN